MGQIADDMIEGRACQLCGQYFTKDGQTIYEHGYPVVCRECWVDLTDEEKEMYEPAIEDILSGF